MPIYEFVCEDCGKTFEELVLGSSWNDLKCPHCKSERVKKLMSACAFKSGGKFISSGSSACASCTSGSCSTCGK